VRYNAHTRHDRLGWWHVTCAGIVFEIMLAMMGRMSLIASLVGSQPAIVGIYLSLKTKFF
jgi:hypothetical protein